MYPGHEYLTTNREILYRYLPVGAYLAVYIFTCLIGALLMLYDVGRFTAIYGYFSGVNVPVLSGDVRNVALLLLLVAPLLFVFGYWLAFWMTWLFPTSCMDASGGSRKSASVFYLLPPALYLLLLTLGTTSILTFVSFEKLNGWLDYGSYVLNRWVLFENLSFFEFVNIYTLIPLTAIWTFVIFSKGNLSLLLFRLSVLGGAVLIQSLPFQKIAIVVTLISFALAVFIHAHINGRSYRFKPILVVGALILATYYVLVTLPILA